MDTTSILLMCIGSMMVMLFEVQPKIKKGFNLRFYLRDNIVQMMLTALSLLAVYMLAGDVTDLGIDVGKPVGAFFAGLTIHGFTHRLKKKYLESKKAADNA